jgi:hypothetical protein
LFISYSRCDAELLERLRKMLSPLKTYHDLEIWDDSRIQAGARWRGEIDQALARTRVALLLVSADFFASDFVREVELPKLFTAEKERGLRILWVPVSPCLWRVTELREIQAALHPPDHTLLDMSEREREKAFEQIGLQIHKAFQEDAALRLQEQRDRDRRAEEMRQVREREEQRRRDAEREDLRRHYETEVRQAIEQAFPLSKAAQEALEQLRLRLALGEEEAALLREPLLAAKAQVLQRAEEERRAREQRERRPVPVLIRTQTAVVVKVGSPAFFWDAQEWRVERRTVAVEGYQEELDEGVAITMVRIPAGEFLMGSPPEEPQRDCNEGPEHLVTLKSFFLGQTPITQAQWQVVAGWPKVRMSLNSDPSEFKGSDRPVPRQPPWPVGVNQVGR